MCVVRASVCGARATSDCRLSTQTARLHGYRTSRVGGGRYSKRQPGLQSAVVAERQRGRAVGAMLYHIEQSRPWNKEGGDI